MSLNLRSPNPPSQTASLYKRLFAWALAGGGRRYDAQAADRKRRLLGGLSGAILEIGPGGGPNLAYYAPGVHWIGVETNPAMLPYLQAEASRLGRPIELRTGGPVLLPAEDASLDAVVSTLVLCSVPHLEQTLQEIRRVLKPGGTFAFIEHVAAPPGTSLRRSQGLISPLWQLFGDGCHPDRETGPAIQAAGFSRVEIESFTVDVPFVSPQIMGTALK